MDSILFFAFVLIIEVLLSFTLILGSYNRYMEKKDQVDMIEANPILEKSIISFVNSGNSKLIQEEFDTILDQLNQEDCFLSRAEIYTAFGFKDMSSQLIIYDNYTADIFFPDLVAGQYPQGTNSEGALEVIYLDSGKGGPSIGSQFEVTDISEKKIVVVGISKLEDSLLLNRGSTFYAGINFDLNIMFQNRNQMDFNFLSKKEVLEGNSKHFQLYYFDHNTDEAKLNEIRNDLNQDNYSYTVSELMEESRKILNDRVKKDLPMNFTLLLILLSGILSISVLHLSKNSRNFHIFRLVGASKKDCIQAYFLSYLILFFLALAIFFLAMNLMYSFDHSGRQYVFRVKPALKKTLIVASILLSILCSLPVLWKLRKD